MEGKNGRTDKAFGVTSGFFLRLHLRRGRAMDAKMKSCFTPHILMHGLFGLGLGILLVAIIPGLRSLWLGLVLMAVAVVLDYTRKT
jgi:hypothetical protein